MIKIEQKYQGARGCGIIIPRMADHLAGEIKTILPSHHVSDVIILKANSRPSVISVLQEDSDKLRAKVYSRTLVRLLKRLCVVTHIHSESLSFESQVYYIGSGFDCLDEKISYPEDYVRPAPGTLDIVRWTLAGILLQCEPMVDRYGDIMVRHLTSIQAKLLWEEKSKITVVEGKAGSGKTIVALEQIRRTMQHNKDQSKTVYLCRGRGLAAFIKFQTEMMGVCVDIKVIRPEMMTVIDGEYFSQYTDIFIDDAHAIPLTGKPNFQDMYHSANHIPTRISFWTQTCKITEDAFQRTSARKFRT